MLNIAAKRLAMATNTFLFLFTAPVWKYWQSLCDTHTHRQAKFGIFYLSFSWWCLCVWMCLQLLMSTRLSSHHNRQLSARRQVEIRKKLQTFLNCFLSLSLSLSFPKPEQCVVSLNEHCRLLRDELWSLLHWSSSLSPVNWPSQTVWLPKALYDTSGSVGGKFRFGSCCKKVGTFETHFTVKPCFLFLVMK